jgi:predicted nucleic acid-binding protein
MQGFWDSSAIVPWCVFVENPQPARRLLRQYTPVVWWGTGVEVVSAICRGGRQGLLPAHYQEVANHRLAVLRESWREIQPTNLLRDLAEACLDRHELRAADAFQLGAALVWCNEKPRNRAFLCRDLRLQAAARAEGFSIIDL